MSRAQTGFGVEYVLLNGGGGHVCVLEMLPNDVDGQIGGVAHVASIESVVAQLVEQYFIRREVMAHWHFTIGLLVGHKRVYGQQEGALAQLVGMQTVGYVTNGADGEYNRASQFGQAAEQWAPSVDNLSDGEPRTCKLLRRHLVAVGHHPPLMGTGSQGIDVGCAERDEQEGSTLQLPMGKVDGLVAVLQTPVAVGVRETAVMHPRVPQALALDCPRRVDLAVVKGMGKGQGYGQGIIERAEGIAHNVMSCRLQLLPNVVGIARAE